MARAGGSRSSGCTSRPWRIGPRATASSCRGPTSSEGHLGSRPRRVAFYGAIGNRERFHESFRKSLEKVGWTHGRNAEMQAFPTVAKGAGSLADRQAAAIVDVLAWKPDVIVTAHTRDALALKRATDTVPIVFAWVDDPVKAGLVRSLSHPGGNVTGAMNSEVVLATKRIEIARVLLPKARRVAVLLAQSNELQFRELMVELKSRAAAVGLDIEAIVLPDEGRVAGMLERLAASRAQAMFILGSLSFGRGTTVEEFDRAMRDYQVRTRIPLISNSLEDSDCCVAVAEPLEEMFRRAAYIVAKVLSGVHPSQIPVDQAMRVELWVNLSVARTMGIEVPAALLARADKVNG